MFKIKNFIISNILVMNFIIGLWVLFTSSLAITFTNEPKGKLFDKLHRHIASIRKREATVMITNAIGSSTKTSPLYDKKSQIYKETKSKFEENRHRRYVIRRKSRSKRNVDKAETKFYTISPQRILDDNYQWINEDDQRIYFNMTGINRYTLENANLLINIENAKKELKTINDRLTVDILLYKSNDLNDYEKIELGNIEEQYDTEDDVNNNNYNNNWITYDMTDVIHKWIGVPSDNYGISVNIRVTNNDYVIYDEYLSYKTASRIYIEITNAELKLNEKRTITNINDDKCHGKNNTCCRYSYEFNFDDEEWNWIIAPKILKLYYCAGTCSNNLSNRNPHSELTKLSISDDGCCAPTDTSPVNIMYVDSDGNYQVKAVPGLLVTRCGCR